MPIYVRGAIAKRPRKPKKKERVRKPKPRKHTRQALKVRANKQVAAQLLALAPAKPTGCQHPRSRARGICQSRALQEKQLDGSWRVIEFDIPPTYKPELRHVDQPDITRPRARLCAQHKFSLDAHNASIATGTKDGLPVSQGGNGRDPHFMHSSRCAVCAKLRLNPGYERTINAWIRHGFHTTEAATELGVTVSSFNLHAQYFGLDKKRGDKLSREEVLNRVIEEGLRSRKVTMKDAVMATKEIGRLRGDVADNVNLDARVLSKSLDSLSNDELFVRQEELKRRLAALETGPS